MESEAGEADGKHNEILIDTEDREDRRKHNKDYDSMNSLSHRRRALALIRLDNPSEVVKKVSRTQQKYDVTAAEWNPTQSQGHTFVLAVSCVAH